MSVKFVVLADILGLFPDRKAVASILRPILKIDSSSLGWNGHNVCVCVCVVCVCLSMLLVW